MKEFMFKTRYDLGEKVVGFDSTNNKLVEFEINRISFDLSLTDILIWYHDDSVMFREKDVYRARQDFIDNL
jgi:hypothetical protein